MIDWRPIRWALAGLILGILLVASGAAWQAADLPTLTDPAYQPETP